MNQTFDNCRLKLNQLIEWNQGVKTSCRNEDTTRFHLIDTILTDCLNWDKSNIVTEQSYDGEYADYTLSIARPVAIVEAKRESNYFEIPSGKKDIYYSITSLCKDNIGLKKAIEQVADYCQKRGVEIAIVSNGVQFVIFIAVRLDGIPPLQGYCITFSSLEQIQNNFLDFWNYLSPSGIETKNLKNKLLGNILPELPPKLSSKINGYPGVKNRNSLQTDLQILSDLVLEDIIKYKELEPIFLKECYCSAGAISNYSTVSREILKTRYENLFEKNSENISIKPAMSKSGIDRDLKSIASQSISKRPILLIGDVGVGKSSFINNLINVEAKDVFEKCITFKVDLGTKIILQSDIKNAIVDEIIRLLDEEYNIDIYEYNSVKNTYFGEYEKFKKGIYKPLFDVNSEKAVEKTIEFFEEKQKNKIQHLQKSLAQIAKSQNRQIVIFIDNCDQRDYNTQQTAFLISQEIADSWQPVTVFISLRPETFHNSLKKGALSGYHPKAFTIPPPRVDLVIEKRLEFAQKISNGEYTLSQFEGTIGINSQNLKEMLQVLIYSLDTNSDLYRFIENISCGNIRYAIDIVKNFLGSGHIDTLKILRKNLENIQEGRKSYIIALHEFLRAVIFGNGVYFHPESSYIVNLFDVHYQEEKEHFLLPIILTILDQSINSIKNNGFIEVLSLSNHLQGVGYTIDQIDTSLSYLISKNLIEPSTRGISYDKDKLPSSLRITTTGSYHLHFLPTMFTYIDAIIVDTPIFDKKIRQLILDEESIHKRLIRSEIFIDYLDDVWDRIKEKQNFYDWNIHSKQVKSEIKRIKNIIGLDLI